MAEFRLTFTERRRARLAKQVGDRLEQLEPRTTITEPISFMAMSLMSMFRGLSLLGVPRIGGGTTAAPSNDLEAGQRLASAAPLRLPTSTGDSLAITIEPAATTTGGHGGAVDAELTGSIPPSGSANPANDWLDLSPSSSADSAQSGISTPWQPAQPKGGGAAMAPRGGSGNGAQAATIALVRGQVAALHVPAPQQAGSAAAGGAASAALLAAVASASGQQSFAPLRSSPLPVARTAVVRPRRQRPPPLLRSPNPPARPHTPPSARSLPAARAGPPRGNSPISPSTSGI